MVAVVLLGEKGDGGGRFQGDDACAALGCELERDVVGGVHAELMAGGDGDERVGEVMDHDASVDGG